MDEYTRPSKRRTVRRRAPVSTESDTASDETSAAPGGVSSTGGDCGHSNCVGSTCNVHYVGPTSPLSDHHIYHAARASSHIWAAAIISGLAVVLTGVVAYSSVQASDAQQEATLQRNMATHEDVDQLFERISALEASLQTTKEACANARPVNNLPIVPPTVSR